MLQLLLKHSEDSNQWPAIEEAERQPYIIKGTSEKRLIEKAEVQPLRESASKLDWEG